ncbi:MAG: peptidoglycan-associated lipoprotein Pal [Bacteriovoracaceae bacterium]|nr:peptidoglycan-associated lipoprotein Pal [Bacteriovoracaceae bacterium]
MFKNVFLCLLITATLIGCSSQQKKGSTSSTTSQNDENDNTMEDSSVNSSNDSVSPEELAKRPLSVGGSSDLEKAGALQTIFFDFSSNELSSSAKKILSSNAEFMKENSGVKVQVEGHCDERGSIEYNLSLGQRRAQSVKDYLATQGISSHRLSTISYGKEKPLVSGSDEDSWSANRRANFVVTAK